MSEFLADCDAALVRNNNRLALAAALLVATWVTSARASSAQEAGQPDQDPPSAAAGTADGDDSANLAKKLSNPVASLISVPFQANEDLGLGPGANGDKFTLNIQPVVPISITKDANLIVRTIIPLIYQHDLRGNGASDFGLGDTVQSFFYSPKRPTSGGIIWGAGPVFLYPSGTSNYTTGKKWGVGPTFVVLKVIGSTTVGLLANHIWSVAGSDTRPPVSSTFIQPFIAYTTRKATTFSLNSESTYNWQTRQWLVPINALVSQLVRIGKQPVSFGVGGRYYVTTPDLGPRWGFRFVMTLLYPKKA